MIPFKLIITATILIFFIFTTKIDAKRVLGDIVLNSEFTEYSLGKFSFSSHIDGTITGAITFPGEAKSYFRNRNHNLIISIFDDASWETYQRMIKKGSLCRERISKSLKNYPIALAATGGNSNVVNFRHEIHQSPSVLNTHSIISDCTLEDFPSSPPRIHYDINFLNGNGQHLPQDEIHLPLLLSILLLPVVACLIYIIFTLYTEHKQTSQFHLIQLLILLTFSSVFFSLIAQLCHLYVYSYDGFGLKLRHTWFAMDFFSELCQLISEICITFIFLSISLFGWLFSAQSSKMASVLQMKYAPLALFYIFFQLFLQKQGRKYETDFNYFFYDITHLPGFIMMILRCFCLCIFVLGLLISSGFISVVVKKIPALSRFLQKSGILSKSQMQRVDNDENVGWLSGETQASQINTVFLHIGIIGFFWFISLPFSQFVAQFFFNPSIRRLAIVTISLGTHLCTIFWLCYAFQSKNSIYFKHSSLLHMGNSVFGSTSHIASNKISID